MTANDLINIFLRLKMGEKEESSDFMFDDGNGSPFGITGVHLDEDGDICLECDERADAVLNARELAEAVGKLDGNRTVYFVTIDQKGESVLYNIKDGGTRDRYDPELKMITVGELVEVLGQYNPDSLLHFESGTINFTINAIYLDDEGCVCLESNEIEELADYPISMIMSDLLAADLCTNIYFYDDESKDYYGIYTQERKVGPEGDLWINVR